MGDAGEVLTTLKLLIIGESGVGKSSLLLRFTDDAFDPEQAATIVSCISKSLSVLFSKNILLFLFKESKESDDFKPFFPPKIG